MSSDNDSIGRGLKRLGADIADDVRRAVRNIMEKWLDAMKAGWPGSGIVFIVTVAVVLSVLELALG